MDLMKAIGYGKGTVTRAGRDGGIDGVMREDPLGFKKTTELMIKHGVDVSVQKTYSIKRIDSDYFIEN